jgi:hypothetical protein
MFHCVLARCCGHAAKGRLRVSWQPGSRLGRLVLRSGDVVNAVPTRRVTIRHSLNRLVLTGYQRCVAALDGHRHAILRETVHVCGFRRRRPPIPI